MAWLFLGIGVALLGLNMLPLQIPALKRQVGNRQTDIVLLEILPVAFGAALAFCYPGIREPVFVAICEACMAVGFLIGLLDPRHSFRHAFVLGAITTLAMLFFQDGTGAFVGVIAFPLFLSWPLIGLGMIIRRLFKRSGWRHLAGG